MPVLFAVWANLHGGWIVGLGVLGVWSGCGLFTRTIPWGWAIGGNLLGFLGTLVTPYGIDLWQFLLETVGLARPDITEWRPITNDAISLALWAVAASLIVVAYHRKGLAALPVLVPAVVLSVMAFRVVRLQGFFAMTSVLLLARCYAAFGPERLPLSRRPARRDILAVGAMCLAGMLRRPSRFRSS